MPIISDRTTIYRADGSSETLPSDEARYLVYRNPGVWSFTAPPPPGWQFEVPRYRLTKDLQPAQKARFRHEPPFSETWESDVWQYGEHSLKAKDEITTTAWPHASMRPLTYSAEKILAFYIGGMKSRLTVSPRLNGQVRLDNGFSNVPVLADVRPPQVPPFNSRPAA
jgi:hypothetical protein